MTEDSTTPLADIVVDDGAQEPALPDELKALLAVVAVLQGIGVAGTETVQLAAVIGGSCIGVAIALHMMIVRKARNVRRTKVFEATLKR